MARGLRDPRYKAETVAGVLVREFSLDLVFQVSCIWTRVRSSSRRCSGSAVSCWESTRCAPPRFTLRATAWWSVSTGRWRKSWPSIAALTSNLWLPFTLMAYRSAQQEATGYTPARMMFGQEMRLPLDLANGRPPGEVLPQTAPEFVVALQQQMEATRRATFASLGKP